MARSARRRMRQRVRSIARVAVLLVHATPTPLAGIVRSVAGGARRCCFRHLHVPPIPTEYNMSKILRGLAAGYGAKKLGGGCFTTVLVFIILWWLPGHLPLIHISQPTRL